MPLVPQVREGGDTGLPIVVKDPQSESAKLFRELAQKVAREVVILDAKTQSSGGLEIGRF
jgi:ATP-binding protein involved in chromosome partitioning